MQTQVETQESIRLSMRLPIRPLFPGAETQETQETQKTLLFLLTGNPMAMRERPRRSTASRWC